MVDVGVPKVCSSDVPWGLSNRIGDGPCAGDSAKNPADEAISYWKLMSAVAPGLTSHCV